MSLDLLLVAEDLSAFYRPPRWRVGSWLKWKRHQQPVDIARGMLAALHGEFAPLRRYGIAVTPGNEIAEEIYRQAAKLRGFASD